MNMMKQKTKKVIIPTYNAGSKFKDVLDTLKVQNALKKEDIMIVDSSSTDGTQELVKKYGYELIIIPKEEFGHGKTRKMAAEKAGNVEIVVFMTQDALPYDENTISNICAYFDFDEKLSAVYGRQVPYPDTDVFGTHARLFNYPEKSYIREFEDRKKYGIKTAFFSDTFGAYKKKVLDELGSFPDVEFSEDTCMAGKMLVADYKVGYCAEAKVYHSHTFTIMEEYRRCKEIGKFYKQEKWLLDTFGKAEGEGIRFVKSQFKYLMDKKLWHIIPEVLLRNVMKYVGFKMG